MRKTMVVKTLLSFLGIIILSACRKTPITDTVVPGKVYSYFNRPYLQKINGQVLFEVNNGDNSQARTKGAQIYGGFDAMGGTFNIGEYNINPSLSDNLAYDSLYGKVISYSIKPPINEGSALLTGSFYSPAPIYATNIPMPSQTPNYIAANSPFTLTWNADANNANGINIEADYFPTSFQNSDLAAKGDSLYIENSILLPDNGSSSIPASFFAKFPTGACLWIFVGRGNAVYVQSGKYIYLVNGFFRSSFFAVKK